MRYILSFFEIACGKDVEKVWKNRERVRMGFMLAPGREKFCRQARFPLERNVQDDTPLKEAHVVFSHRAEILE
jgi:hypothetical protein